MTPGVDAVFVLKGDRLELVPTVPPTADEKRCASCGRTLPRYWFQAGQNRADGLKVYCKPCCHGWDPSWNVDELLRLTSTV